MELPKCFRGNRWETCFNAGPNKIRVCILQLYKAVQHCANGSMQCIKQILLVDIEDTGRQSDGSVYTNSNLGNALENNQLNIPKPSKLLNSNHA